MGEWPQHEMRVSCNLAPRSNYQTRECRRCLLEVRPGQVSAQILSKFFFFRWRQSPLRALACQTIPLHFSPSFTNSLHLLTPSTWRSLSTSSLHLFLGLPLRLVPSSSSVKILLGIQSSSILSRWPSQLILCPFIHFTIFFPLLNYSSSRFVLLFHSPASYLGPYILLNIFLSKISRTCSSFFVIAYVSTPYVTAGLISVLYSRILVYLEKSLFPKRLITAK